MSKYRRTIITLDDTPSEKDYMLLAMFEKLWPNMQYVTIVLETYQLRRHVGMSYGRAPVLHGQK